MIYYITVIDTDGNEYIRNTWDDPVKAAEELETLRLEDPTSGLEYRIDAVPNTKEEVRAANAGIKAEMNRQYGKAKMDHEEGYPDTDSMRTKDFTIEELFPQGFDIAAYTITCTECACEVKTQRKYVKQHVNWHNKLLP